MRQLIAESVVVSHMLILFSFLCGCILGIYGIAKERLWSVILSLIILGSIAVLLIATFATV